MHRDNDGKAGAPGVSHDADRGEPLCLSAAAAPGNPLFHAASNPSSLMSSGIRLFSGILPVMLPLRQQSSAAGLRGISKFTPTGSNALFDMWQTANVRICDAS